MPTYRPARGKFIRKTISLILTIVPYNSADATAATQGIRPSTATSVEAPDIGQREIVVTAPKPKSAISDAKAEESLNPTQIHNLRARTVGELIQRLREREGNDNLSVIVNGRRLASLDAIAQLPPEALQSIDLFSPRTGSRFGFTSNARMVSLTLQPSFASIALDGAFGTTLRGGGDEQEQSGRRSRIDNSKTNVISVSRRSASGLLRAQRRNPNTSHGHDDSESLIPKSQSRQVVLGQSIPLSGISIDGSIEIIKSSIYSNLGILSDDLLKNSRASSSSAAQLSNIINNHSLGINLTASGVFGSRFLSLLASRRFDWSKSTLRSKGNIYFDQSFSHSRKYDSSSSRGRSENSSLTASMDGSALKLPGGMVNLTTSMSVDMAKYSLRSDSSHTSEENRSTSLDGQIFIPVVTEENDLGFGRWSINGRVGRVYATRSKPLSTWGFGLDAAINQALSLSFNQSRTSRNSDKVALPDDLTDHVRTMYDWKRDKRAIVEVYRHLDDGTRAEDVRTREYRVNIRGNVKAASLWGTFSLTETRISNPFLIIDNPLETFELIQPKRFTRNISGDLVGYDASPLPLKARTIKKFAINIHGSWFQGNAATPVKGPAEPRNPISLDFSLNAALLSVDNIEFSDSREVVNLIKTPLQTGDRLSSALQIQAQASVTRGHLGYVIAGGWQQRSKALNGPKTSENWQSRITPVKLSLEFFHDLDGIGRLKSGRIGLSLVDILNRGADSIARGDDSNFSGRTIKISGRALF
jgi:hypothetical protein